MFLLIKTTLIKQNSIIILLYANIIFIIVFFILEILDVENEFNSFLNSAFLKFCKGTNV